MAHGTDTLRDIENVPLHMSVDAEAGTVAGGGRNGVIVLGMHRSGTSVLMNILGELGFHIGEAEELTPATWENPKGFFERRDMRALCDQMLQAVGADWWKVSDFTPEALATERARDALGEFRSIIARLEARGRWALKEPRLCILFPLLAGVLTTPAVIVAVRHPLEVATSLHRRNGIPTVVGLALWEVYTCSALRVSAGLPRSVVLHHELLADPEGCVAALQRDIPSMGFSVALRNAAAAVVDPSLNRSMIDGEDANDALSGHQRALWEALSRREAIDETLLSVPRATFGTLREFEANEVERRERAVEHRAAIEHAQAERQEALRALEKAAIAEVEPSRAKRAAEVARGKRIARLGRANRPAEMLFGQAMFPRRREPLRILRLSCVRLKYRLLQGGLYRWFPAAFRNARDERVLKGSVFIAPKWYADRYMAPGSILSPLTHFVARGWREGNNPSPYFDTAWYLAQHPELAAKNLNPLVHFLRVGGRSGALPTADVRFLSIVRNASRDGDLPIDVAEAMAERIRRQRRNRGGKRKGEARRREAEEGTGE